MYLHSGAGVCRLSQHSPTNRQSQLAWSSPCCTLNTVSTFSHASRLHTLCGALAPSQHMHRHKKSQQTASLPSPVRSRTQARPHTRSGPHLERPHTIPTHILEQAVPTSRVSPRTCTLNSASRPPHAFRFHTLRTLTPSPHTSLNRQSLQGRPGSIGCRREPPGRARRDRMEGLWRPGLSLT
jgi:hypothetical protein